MSDEPIVTYHSDNAPAGREWVAYVDIGSDYLGIRFQGTTEADVRSKASDFWAKDQAKREATIAARQEARAKAAETEAAKSQPAAA